MLRRFSYLVVCLCVFAVGCRTTDRYEGRLDDVVDSVTRGHISEARSIHEVKIQAHPTLLSHFELGELYLLEGQIDRAIETMLAADAIVKEWESQTRLDPRLLLEDIGSIVVNDKIRSYKGYDFEKVLLTTRIALMHLILGDLDSARVAIKSTHEREAMIQQFRENQKNYRDSQGSYSVEELNGYPIETIATPEAEALRNSYQNALSHYLAGFIYEQLNEPSLAAPGYRNALELRPKRGVLMDSLKGLESRMSRPQDDGKTDLLVIYEQGFAPAKSSLEIYIPVPQNDRILQVPVSFPIYPGMTSVVATELSLDGYSLVFDDDVLDIDSMARRSLKDEIPAILLRTVTRASFKTAIQNAAREIDETGLLGDLIAVAAVASESADDRSWRMLPNKVGIGRIMVEKGEHQLTLNGRTTMNVQAAGRSMIVFIRDIGGQQYIQQAVFN